MSKHVKQMMINEIRSQIGDCRDLLVVDSSKVEAFTENKWRLALHKKKIRALGVKNAVARRALADIGITSLDKALTGASTLIWGGEDIVALAKEIVASAKEVKNLAIKGGTLSGTALSAQEVDALSKSPGKKELLGQLVTLFLSPGARLGGALLGAGGRLAGQVQAIAEKTDDAVAEPAAS
jgi:large subunit ribosomal protein L10